MSNLIKKEFIYRGETKDVFFRELNAGEQLKLSQGYKSTVRGGESEVVFDLGIEGERAHRLLHLTLVTEDGKSVYSSLAKLHEEPSSKINKLVALAREASAEFGEQDKEAGND